MTSLGKRVLFLCGSPRGKKSASLSTAKYLAQFLDYDYQFVDVARARLSTDPTEAEPAFLEIVEKMQVADAVVWTFGAWCLFVSVKMQYLLDKLFTQGGYDFGGKIAAAVMTSARIKDDVAESSSTGCALSANNWALATWGTCRLWAIHSLATSLMRRRR